MECTDYRTGETVEFPYSIKDDVCCNCGTSLVWHLKQSKRNRVYVMDIDDMVCSKRCHKEHALSYMQIDKVIKETP